MSIYSNLYLSFPAVVPGITELIVEKPANLFWISGTIQQGCNRNLQLVTVLGDGTSESVYGAQIRPNTSGRAAVTTLKDDGTGNSQWISDFYVDGAVDPLNLNIANVGSFYGITTACFGANVYANRLIKLALVVWVLSRSIII
jgi:hypothetical protein